MSHDKTSKPSCFTCLSSDTELIHVSSQVEVRRLQRRRHDDHNGGFFCLSNESPLQLGQRFISNISSEFRTQTVQQIMTVETKTSGAGSGAGFWTVKSQELGQLLRSGSKSALKYPPSNIWAKLRSGSCFLTVEGQILENCNLQMVFRPLNMSSWSSSRGRGLLKLRTTVSFWILETTTFKGRI